MKIGLEKAGEKYWDKTNGKAAERDEKEVKVESKQN